MDQSYNYLKRTYVIQERTVDGKMQVRFNPFNPISYVVAIFVIVTIILFCGFKELIREWENPFKWQ